jgi:hypothetical protein
MKGLRKSIWRRTVRRFSLNLAFVKIQRIEQSDFENLSAGATKGTKSPRIQCDLLIFSPYNTATTYVHHHGLEQKYCKAVGH